MATNILGQVTLDQLQLIEVDSDPSTGGISTSIGSLALMGDGVGANAWLYYGGGATNWRRVFTAPDNTTLTLGSIPYINANGNLAQDNANLFWDSSNKRLGIGTAAPDSKLEIQNVNVGDVGLAIRLAASPTGNVWQVESSTPTVIAQMTAALNLQVGNGTNALPSHSFIGDPDTGMYENGANILSFATNGVERLRAHSDGTVIVGTGATSVDATGASVFPPFQIIGTTSSTSQMASIMFSADALPPVFNLLKSRGALNAQGALVANDELGRLQFRGSDGTAFLAGASIRAAIDGTVATNSLPTRLLIMTTPSGSNAPTERMRFDNSGIMTMSTGRANAAANTTSVSGTYSIVPTDFVLMVTTSSAVTINLPDPATRRFFWIKDISALAETNHIILHRFASESIEGIALDKTMRSNAGGWMVASDGTNWYIL